jgi:hypothetical protein
MLRSGRFWFAFVFAVVLLLPGLYLTARTVYCLLTYQKSEGVARFEARGRRGIGRYKIIYHADGKSYTVGDSAASWLGMGYQAEEKVKVLYPADDPGAGVVATFSNLWFWPLFVVLCPLIFILPVAGWARKGIEENRIAALGAEGQAERDRKMRARWRQRRERGGRDEEY